MEPFCRRSASLVFTGLLEIVTLLLPACPIHPVVRSVTPPWLVAGVERMSPLIYSRMARVRLPDWMIARLQGSRPLVSMNSVRQPVYHAWVVSRTQGPFDSATW
ncbi:hypothetical protein BX600DRAFT_446121 [Xylariales sp. PMI_506]|nr:hypothetical protein BX600DRAFT_446121 [Xylariales sp. PMI_506]